ncbi:LLM class flavin-dependent oxidoreductase [Williamsia deligens]|uniref:LLM class flavin-dependent oxidoreductase n=1 Tax=Williamsia deligens TaxID=321325 RepID=A0ABW3G650_9NOCA|nr:LLM class flavin-dependent oxidoreductase [Williamsia deligens]MCP2193070.1 Flavin-dependent oxidoreductase, luciferase family (includes alkanesulfonate monooxygenase SsuD and methylene tetrahydromethanopterin reductase) [Williamsia deligens]
MTVSSDHIHLVVALEGAGWHPAAWREDTARPDALLGARYWVDLVATAERAAVDAVTIEDSFGLRPTKRRDLEPRTDLVSGRLDAVLLANRIAPTTSHIGFLPTAVVTHTEPFHTSKAIATLDHVSGGRAGVRLQVSARPHEAALFGRREFPAGAASDPTDPANAALVGDLFREAHDYAEVLRRLWDSWEDDAEIRDVATGRFVDRDKLHYIDFEGAWFSVRGPSITPRSPQGQPLIAALGHQAVPFEFIGESADIGFITPADTDEAADIVAAVDAAHRAADRSEPVRILVDLVVVLGDTTEQARDTLARLDDRFGSPLRSDAEIVAGTATDVADRIVELTAVDGISGLRLRPARLPDDLTRIAEDLVPELRRRGVFREQYGESSLRERFGLTPRPVNRYATTGGASA